MKDQIESKIPTKVKCGFCKEEINVLIIKLSRNGKNYICPPCKREEIENNVHFTHTCKICNREYKSEFSESSCCSFDCRIELDARIKAGWYLYGI